jgi:hypothetical protein
MTDLCLKILIIEDWFLKKLICNFNNYSAVKFHNINK